MKLKSLRSHFQLGQRSVFLFAFTFLVQLASIAQFYPDKTDYRLGISFGLSPSRSLGTELEKPSFKTGIQSGIFYRFRLNPILHGEANFDVALRGSKFKHSKDDYYQQLNLILVEAPLLMLFDLKKKTEQNFILAGLAPSYLAQSEFYIIPEPTGRDEFRNFGLSKYNLGLVVGYHRNTYYNGWRFTATYSLLNMNDGLELPDILPATGKGGDIRILAFAVQTYF
ncbi:MAG: hypothetical protein H6606_03050 [Flavobacteriales bacterium]|nr:hypothetical protein [Flavobacteriales bacterium]